MNVELKTTEGHTPARQAWQAACVMESMIRRTPLDADDPHVRRLAAQVIVLGDLDEIDTRTAMLGFLGLLIALGSLIAGASYAIAGEAEALTPLQHATTRVAEEVQGECSRSMAPASAR